MSRNDMRPEYPADPIKSGECGKYSGRYREGANVVVIEPSLHRLFPDSESVNRALRQYAREHNLPFTADEDAVSRHP